MIEVTIFKRSDNIAGFKVSGHAGYAESGKDIVCAAVSALVINFINSVETFTDDDFSGAQNDGFIEFEFAGDISSASNLLMDSLILGLETILEDNKQYIKLDYKEV